MLVEAKGSPEEAWSTDRKSTLTRVWQALAARDNRQGSRVLGQRFLCLSNQLSLPQTDARPPPDCCRQQHSFLLALAVYFLHPLGPAHHELLRHCSPQEQARHQDENHFRRSTCQEDRKARRALDKTLASPKTSLATISCTRSSLSPERAEREGEKSGQTQGLDSDTTLQRRR